MNNARRKKLQAVVAVLDEIRAEEEEAFENLPESIQDGERGDRMQETVSDLEEIVGQIETLIEEA